MKVRFELLNPADRLAHKGAYSRRCSRPLFIWNLDGFVFCHSLKGVELGSADM
jgi:hypothetical protein